MSLRNLLPLFVFFALIVAAAAGRNYHSRHSYRQAFRKYRCEKRAPLVCHFLPTTGNTVTGRAVFTPRWHCGRCLVRVRGSVSGLKPSVSHGWHIHAYGDLSLSDGTSTGGHFTSPRMEARPHGFPNQNPRHWGDLGNLVADKNGHASFDEIDRMIRLR
eukprot:IDg20459t1